MIRKLLISVTALSFFVSCSDDNSENDEMEDVVEETVLTYDDDIASSLAATQCLNCHDDPTANGAPFSLNTFELVSARSEQILNAIQGINGAPIMPPGSNGLSEMEVAAFQQWIDDGMLEN